VISELEAYQILNDNEAGVEYTQEEVREILERTVSFLRAEKSKLAEIIKNRNQNEQQDSNHIYAR
jgi:hypothetical protein